MNSSLNYKEEKDLFLLKITSLFSSLVVLILGMKYLPNLFLETNHYLALAEFIFLLALFLLLLFLGLSKELIKIILSVDPKVYVKFSFLDKVYFFTLVIILYLSGMFFLFLS